MQILIREFLRYLLVSILVGCCIASVAQVNRSKEYEIKAAFLFNFTQFIEWPSKTFTAADAPFVIGVLGKDPFGNYLDAIIKGEKINNHPLTVKRLNSIKEARDCHILFINAEDKDLAAVLERLKASNTLTVGDTHTFAKEGGMIGFLTESKKIRIQINLEVAQNADLAVSSKLLRVAEIVSSEK